MHNRVKLAVFGCLFVVIPFSITFLVSKAGASPQLVWSKEYPGVVNNGNWVAQNAFKFSSPLPLQYSNGAVDIIIGGASYYPLGGAKSITPSNAKIYEGETGNELRTFEAPVGSISIAQAESTNPTLYFGAGGSEVNCQGDGGLFIFKKNGNLVNWPQHYSDESQYEGIKCSNPTIFSSPALADLDKDGSVDVAFGALGLKAWATNADGIPKFGWPYYWDDTQSASPALADITGDGQSEVIIAGDSSPGAPVDHRGGMVIAFTGKGQKLWEFRTNENIRSSPSIGDVTGNNDIEIVFGTGNYWSQQPGGASDCSKVFVVRRNGTLVWSKDIGAQVMTSPTLADFNGDGRLDIAVGGWRRPCNPPSNTNDGRVWILDGVTGEPLSGFPRESGGHLIIGQIVTADVNNDGGQDAIVPTANGIHIFSGKTGVELYTLDYGGDGISFKNSPLVTDLDSDGNLDIVTAGVKGDGITGVIRRYEFEPTDNAVLGNNGWHMSRKDVRQTGSWSPPEETDAPTGENGKGYWMVAADGGVFPFGEAKSFGSAGNINLAAPMVGIESTPSGNGYWLVASDGGIFTYGDARYFGSTGNINLNKPIVGMTSTPSGNGYWLVASDGGIFPFGDAVGKGSTGNVNLTKPMVGMSRTKTGNGYWLVAADGGIFPFGDAVGYGSTGNVNLRKPMVGISRTKNGNGYWLVASDGGIFPFGDAVGYGSAGNLPLVKPVNGIARSYSGGYTLVASDGGTFSYNAINYGSLGGLPLFKPIVGVAANGIN